MQLTRRLFLQITGGSLLAGGLLPDQFPALDGLRLAGRALRHAPVLASPGSPVVMRCLWPDSVTVLEGVAEDWFRVRGGVVARRDLQPMPPYTPEAVRPPQTLPALMSVIAPVAPVRAWAAGDAPLVARIGYGGVAQVVDALPDEAGGWYALRDEAAPAEAVLGWTPAVRWSRPPALSDSPLAGDDLALALDRGRAEARLMRRGTILARFPAAFGPQQRTGQHRLADKHPCAVVGGQVGAGWVLGWPGGRLYGAHWHHDLGGPGVDAGWAVAPWAAQWLYASLRVGAAVIVV